MRPGRGASVFCGCEKRGKDRSETRLAKGRGSRVIATNIDGPEANICWQELWYMRNIKLLNRTKSRQSVREVLLYVPNEWWAIGSVEVWSPLPGKGKLGPWFIGVPGLGGCEWVCGWADCCRVRVEGNWIYGSGPKKRVEELRRLLSTPSFI